MTGPANRRALLGSIAALPLSSDGVALAASDASEQSPLHVAVIARSRAASG